MAEKATLIGGVNNTPVIGTITHSAAVEAYEMIVNNGSVAVALNAADADAETSYAMEGPVKFKKKAALAIDEGDKVYFDNTNKEINKTASGNTLAGICTEAAAASDSNVVFAMRMNGA